MRGGPFRCSRSPASITASAPPPITRHQILTGHWSLVPQSLGTTGLWNAHSYKIVQGAFNLNLMHRVTTYDRTWELTLVLHQPAPPCLPSCPSQPTRLRGSISLPLSAARSPQPVLCRGLCKLVKPDDRNTARNSKTGGSRGSDHITSLAQEA